MLYQFLFCEVNVTFNDIDLHDLNATNSEKQKEEIA